MTGRLYVYGFFLLDLIGNNVIWRLALRANLQIQGAVFSGQALQSISGGYIEGYLGCVHASYSIRDSASHPAPFGLCATDRIYLERSARSQPVTCWSARLEIARLSVATMHEAHLPPGATVCLPSRSNRWYK